MPWQCKCRQPGLGGDCDGSCQCPPPPEIWKDCEVCGGEGWVHRPAWVYEAGCGFGHDDVHSVECDACAGNGGFICEAEGDASLREYEPGMNPIDDAEFGMKR